MEEDSEKRGHVGEGADTVKLSESLVQCLHLVRHLEAISTVSRYSYCVYSVRRVRTHPGFVVGLAFLLLQTVTLEHCPTVWSAFATMLHAIPDVLARQRADDEVVRALSEYDGRECIRL